MMDDMQPAAAKRAVASALATATSLGLTTDEASVLHDSNKLTLRLLPAEVVARVAPAAEQNAAFELDVARELAAIGSPVLGPDRRIEPLPYTSDGWVISFWTYAPPLAGAISAQDYAQALEVLHVGMRTLDLTTPHVLGRVSSAQELVASRDLTPGLVDADRSFLAGTLTQLGKAVATGGREQILHGEPHPGNVINTAAGPRFVDFETCCRGPVEFDLAHAPDAVAAGYPGIDEHLLQQCRLLMLALITTWRWDVADEFPDGRRLGVEWLEQLRRQRSRLSLEKDSH